MKRQLVQIFKRYILPIIIAKVTQKISQKLSGTSSTKSNSYNPSRRRF